MRIVALLFIVAFFVDYATGQAISGSVVRLTPTTMPTTCNTGDLRVDSAASNVLKICVSNVWSTIGGSTWGSITGTLSSQADLQAALNLKAALASPTFTGTVTAPTFAGALTGNVTGNVSGTSGSTTGNAATVTTNANLTGPITSSGNVTSVGAQTGTGSIFVMQASPVLTTPNLGTPTTLVGTNITGTASGLTAGTVTTNANLTGDVTSSGNATSYGNVVPIAKGGTNNGSLGVDAGGIYYSDGSKLVNLAHGTTNNVLLSGGTGAPTWGSVTSASAASSIDLINCGLSVTAGSNILTVALKQIDGSTDPSSGAAACAVSMRSSTATSGAINQRSITAALSQTLTAGTTLGATTAAKDMWLWLIDSDGAGTMKLGVSSVLYDEATLQTTVAESFSATATNASPCVFTATAHGMGNNDSIQLVAASLPNGFSASTRYFVVNKAANTFQLSATPGGTAINSSSTGSGIIVHYAGYKMVSDAVYTSMPVRLLGKINETFVTAGNWVAPTTAALRQQFPIREDISVRLTNSATTLSGSLATIVWTNSNANGAFDTHNSSPDKTTIVIPVTGKYQLSIAMFITFTTTVGDQALLYEVLVNGSIINIFDVDTPVVLTQQGLYGSDVLSLNALDLVTVKALAQQTAAAIQSSSTKTFISLSKISPL